MTAPKLKRRSQPRHVCDQCGESYHDDSQSCITIQLEDHPKFWETVCRRCVRRLGFTGCALRRLPDGTRTGVEYVFGRHPPPSDWHGRRPSADELFRVLSTVGYRRPLPEQQPEPLDVEDELERIKRLTVAPAGDSSP